MDQFDDVRQVKQNVFFYFLGYQKPISPTFQSSQLCNRPLEKKILLRNSTMEIKFRNPLKKQ
jgi:hypothetical protein